MNMEMEDLLGADFILMPLKEESEGHNNFLEEVFGPMEEFNDLLTELPFTKDFDALEVPKKIHKFYFVKFPVYENPSLKIKIEEVENIIKRENQARALIAKELQEKKIESLCCRIQHGTNSLSEEKKLLGEIKQMEEEKKKAIAETDLKTSRLNYWSTEEAVRDRIEVLSNELDGLKKEHLEFTATKKLLKGELEAAEREIRCLEKKMLKINRKKDEAYQCILQLKRQRDKEDSFYLQLLSLLNDAKDLAETKDFRVLKDLSTTQVEIFMSRWNGSKTFRDDYENRMVTVKQKSKKW